MSTTTTTLHRPAERAGPALENDLRPGACLPRSEQGTLPYRRYPALHRPHATKRQTHLSKDDAAEFHKRIRTIKAAWDPQVAAKQFDDLCDRFAQTAPTFMAEMRKKRDHYLVFLKYPDGIRRSLSTTNTAEAVNGQLEKIRLNSGGYFQSEAVLKLGAAISTLEHTRWAHPSASVSEALHQLNVMFQARFEAEDD